MSAPSGSKDVLARICDGKRKEVERARATRTLAEIERAARNASPPRGFIAALERSVAKGRYGLIAEIKKASPSAGLIRPDFDPPRLARAYAEGGATCLSVLTDGPDFQGEAAHLTAARDACALPVLRKDFIVDPYQVVEARAIGADCVLLIMAALSDSEATALESLARGWGLDVLVEVHDREELERALKLKTRLIGINNRNLKTLKTDIATTEALAGLVGKERLVVSESGLASPADLARMHRAGVSCFLIGEALMRQADVTAATAKLLAKQMVQA
ncbi:MAG TPA: indole-3-glycerol phosphate synthase TrpC [Stellaceae bacterium]|nr:indole-3-glycerol phosphate synthase TrpC [Stellaceae bacterium]